MIPFLKNKQDIGVSVPDEVVSRKPDDEGGFEMLDAIVEDMFEALQKKDKGLLKSALQSLVEHIKAEDEVQDELLEP